LSQPVISINSTNLAAGTFYDPIKNPRSSAEYNPQHSEVKLMKVLGPLHINKNLPPKFNNSSESNDLILVSSNI